MKTIVTHYAPDVDACTSIWLLKRFLPDWEDAQVAFVPAGDTLNGEIVDSDPDVLHVDTGMGILDHHQTGENTCAAKRVTEYISKFKKSGSKNKENKSFPDLALERMIEIVNDIDHFQEVYFPQSDADFYDISFVGILDGYIQMTIINWSR
jgi:hypothetical protein